MAPPSALTAPDDPLLPWLGASLLGHTGVFVTLLGLQMLTLATAPTPLIDPDQVIEVALAPMPLSDSLPVRAARQAAPEPSEAPPTPELAEPPPPKVSDLAMHDDVPEPAPPQVVPKDSPRETRDVEREMKDLLSELDADVGPRDRDAASPDGVAGAPPSRTVGAGTSDPELRAYIARLTELFLAEFRPLPAFKGQGLRCTVLVSVDDAGRVKEARVDITSGNPSYDRSAIAAAEAVPTVPLPPEKYRDGTARFYRIAFSD